MPHFWKIHSLISLFIVEISDPLERMIYKNKKTKTTIKNAIDRIITFIGIETLSIIKTRNLYEW